MPNTISVNSGGQIFVGGPPIATSGTSNAWTALSAYTCGGAPSSGCCSATGIGISPTKEQMIVIDNMAAKAIYSEIINKLGPEWINSIRLNSYVDVINKEQVTRYDLRISEILSDVVTISIASTEISLKVANSVLMKKILDDKDSLNSIFSLFDTITNNYWKLSELA